MKLICDTDLLSVFAKVDGLDLLQKAFPEGEFLISESVYDELLFSLEEGFEFPEKIFKMCQVISLEHREVEMYKKRRKGSKYRTISKADLRTLIIGKKRGVPILSNDRKLLDLADREGILALDIYDVFKKLFTEDMLTEEESRSILSEMEEKDNAIFRDKENIFD